MEIDPFIFRLSIFILSIFIGYYVVWSVTPSLHTPLMSVTNAISSVIIVGAIIAALAGTSESIFNTSSIFILSIFVGYYVVWSVTPSLHTPLMSVTNAISSVIIVGAIIAALAGSSEKILGISSIFGFIAIVLAAVNIFGGFLVTQRMLQMYKKKKDKKK